MKIIQAEGSVPTNEDGLVIYAGSKLATVATTRDTAVEMTIVTKARVILSAHLRAFLGTKASLPQSSIIDLPYSTTTNSDGTLSIVVIVPGGFMLYYHIIGNEKLAVDVTHREVSEANSPTTVGYVRELDAILAADGTSAVTLLNTTGATFTYTNPSPGLYVITSNLASLFTADKVAIYVTFEDPAVGLSKSYTSVSYIASGTVAQVSVYSNDGTTITYENAPARMFVHIKIYP